MDIKHQDALETLGTIISPGECRDAIHLAVFNAVAGMRLTPGCHVRLGQDSKTAYSAGQEDGVGIVDPFLAEDVLPGQCFWLVIYPRRITSLQHVWEHPAFLREASSAADNPKAIAEQWLRTFCDQSDCPDFHKVVAAAIDRTSWDSEYLHFDGSDAHGEIPPEFWDYMEVYTGQKFIRRAKYFSCSC